jgi:uncharacterized repeat protein (TIGR03803 family)
MKRTFVLVSLFALLAAYAYAATQPVVLYTFACTGNPASRGGPCPAGGRPDALIQGSDGNVYGTAQVSMEGTSSPNGGTVFSLSPTGTFKLLHTFTLGPNKNYPNGNLPGFIVEGSDGKLYGTTLFGGVGGCNGYCGFGVLYRINTDGTGFQIIHKFCSQTNCADGNGGQMIKGTDGNLYGASMEGGTGSCNSYYGTCGGIFRVIPSTGSYEMFFNFNTGAGINPSGLTLAPDGTFYGLDDGTGGTLNLFHYTPATNQATAVAVHFPSFNGLPSHPAGQLTFGANGNLYGLYIIYATSGEGLFEVQPDGSNLTLFPFYTTQAGGGAPQDMILGTDGSLWVDNYNGIGGYGSMVKLSPSTGQLMQTVAPFGANKTVGAYPGSIFQDSKGIFWGTTGQYGVVPQGHFADGTVFSLNLGLPPRP